jgi:YbgC/YbaW family acyl-CoA thioester hydrolase
MDHDGAVALLRRLHEAQNDFYGGGPDTALREVLTADVTWHIPGENAIAGDYRGIGDVLGYFARRRDLAGNTFRMRSRGVLTGTGEWAASITDGTAVLGGRRAEWSTVGLYRFRDGRIAAGRLLPFEAGVFDRVWADHGGQAAESGPVSVLSTRVRPRYCDAQGMVHASRYYEFFEDAFLDWLEEHAGGYAGLRSAGADLVIAASRCDHRRDAGLGDPLAIETRPASAGRTSLSMSFTVRTGADVVAVGRTTYVAVSVGGGRPVPLPGPLAAALPRAGGGPGT